MARNERKVATCAITELIQEDFKIKLTKKYSNFSPSQPMKVKN